MYGAFQHRVAATLAEIEAAGLSKRERVITTPQGPEIGVTDAEHEVLNFCANNYLGLADDPRIVEAAHEGLDDYGFGMASVRFICGTQAPHRELERRISAFLGTQETI